MAKGYYLVQNGSANTAFDLRDLPERKLQNHEVCIAVEGFGLNFADVMARLGQYRECPPLPTILGYEVVGTIAELGSSLSGLQIGQRVLAFTRFGGYAQEVVADHKGVVPIPEGWELGFATALGTQYATAWYSASYVTCLHAGERVLIHAAAGGVGTALVQIAKYKGCTLFGTAGSDKKVDYLRSIGVDYPINYQKTPFYQAVKDTLGAERLDVIFDPIGGKTSKQGFGLLSSGGRMVLYGAASLTGKTSLLARLKFALQFGFFHPVQLMMRSKSIIGVNMLKIGDYRPNALQQVLQEVVQGAKEGFLHPGKTTVFPASELVSAHHALENRETQGKVAIAW